MTTRPQAGVIEDVEPLLEELLAEVLTGGRPESKTHNGESITAALKEAAMATFSRTVSHSSAVERALLAEALAPALAEALAPALAKTLAPEIVSAMSHLAESESTDEAESGREGAESGYEGGEYQESASTDEESSASGSGERGSGSGKSAIKGKRVRE